MSSDRAGPTGPAQTLPCPSCGAEFVVGVPRCRACGLVLTGPLAVRLWQLDLDLEALGARRAEALDALRAASRPGASADAMTQPYTDLRAPDPAPPVAAGPAPVGAPGVAAPPGPSSPAPDPYDAPGAPVVRRSAPGGAPAQHLLLGLGVLLLVVAAVVFFAVTWDLLGVYGRMAALVAAIGLCVGLATYCASRSLSASAEAFAILAVGLTVVGLTAAYALDLFGLGDASLRSYAAGAAVFLAALAAALHPSARTVGTYPLVALCAAWVAPVAAFADERVVGWAAALAVGWVLLASPLLRWARRLVDPADGLLGASRPIWAEHGASGLLLWAPLWPPALASGVLAGAAATWVVGSGRSAASALVLGVAVLAVGLAVVGQALGVARRFTAMPRELVLPAVSFWVVVGAELAALVRNAGVAASVVLAAAAALVLVLLLSVRSERTQAWSPHAGTVTAGAGAASVALVVLDGGAGASAFVLALLSAGSAALAVAERPWRVRAEIVSCAAFLASLAYALVAVDGSPAVGAAVMTVAGVLLTAMAALRRRSQAEEAVFATAAVAALAVAIGLAWTPVMDGGGSFDHAVLTVVFAVCAAVATAYAALPGRGVLLAAAVPLAIAAVWTQLADGDVHLLEAYTLSAAAVCALAGAAVRRRQTDPPSWAVAGPAAAFVLLPSAVVATSSGSGLRVVYVLAVGTAVVLAGTSLRWQALVTVGAAALGLVAIQEAFLLLVELPPTLAFTICGVLLVTAGVRYERNLRDLRQVGAWLDGMT